MDVWKAHCCLAARSTVLVYEKAEPHMLKKIAQHEISPGEVSCVLVREWNNAWCVVVGDSNLMLRCLVWKLSEPVVQLWECSVLPENIEEGEEINTIACRTGDHVVCGTDTSHVVIVAMHDGSVLQRLSGHMNIVTSVLELSGSRVLSVGMDCHVFLWNTKIGSEAARCDVSPLVAADSQQMVNPPLIHCAASLVGGFVLAALGSGGVALVQATSHDLLKVHKIFEDLHGLAIGGLVVHQKAPHRWLVFTYGEDRRIKAFALGLEKKLVKKKQGKTTIWTPNWRCMATYRHSHKLDFMVSAENDGVIFKDTRGALFYSTLKEMLGDKVTQVKLT